MRFEERLHGYLLLFTRIYQVRQVHCLPALLEHIMQGAQQDLDVPPLASIFVIFPLFDHITLLIFIRAVMHHLTVFIRPLLMQSFDYL